MIPIGPRSVLYGAHCFFIHPLFVALAWWKLYGFPRDPRLWIAFMVHDLGYFFMWCGNMDGMEGERHAEWGAAFMGRWFGSEWGDFCLYHSRFYAKKAGQPFSRLCPADKLACALEPWWLYLPRIILSGEIKEYMALAGGKGSGKYKGEPNSAYVAAQLATGTVRGWHRGMTRYCREWAWTHRDGRTDTWTPAPPTTLQEQMERAARPPLPPFDTRQPPPWHQPDLKNSDGPYAQG